jgi:hypothetical protein
MLSMVAGKKTQQNCCVFFLVIITPNLKTENCLCYPMAFASFTKSSTPSCSGRESSKPVDSRCWKIISGDASKLEPAELESKEFEPTDLRQVEPEQVELEPAELRQVEPEQAELEPAELKQVEPEPAELEPAGLKQVELELPEHESLFSSGFIELRIVFLR